MSHDIYLFTMIAIIALVTAGLRFLPFFIFNGNRPVPKLIRHLGSILPCSIMAMLVIYCLKDVSFSKNSLWVPEFISVIVTAIVHIWKRNTLWSIISGTACYMLFIQWI